MAGIGVILNPYSRSNRKNPGRVEELGFIVGDKGSCHTTHSLEDVENLAREFQQRGIEIIGLSGGDGTYQKTLTTLVKVFGETGMPKIALLGGGTMNNVVGCLGTKGSPEDRLGRLIAKYHQFGTPFKETEIPLLKINDRYGFIFGNGILYRFIRQYDAVTHPTPWTAARMLSVEVVHALFHSKRSGKMCARYDAEITVDGKAWPFKNYNSIFCGTIETLGLGFDAMYRARSEGGKFQIIGFSLTPRALTAHFPTMLQGKRVDSEHWLDEMASEVVMHFAEPEGYMVDGELYDPADEIRISLGPTLTLIVE